MADSLGQPELVQRCSGMKRKRQARSKPAKKEAQVPDWVLDEAPKRRKPYTKAEIDELTAGVQAGIEDTPVWKDYVRRFENEGSHRFGGARGSRPPSP